MLNLCYNCSELKFYQKCLTLYMNDLRNLPNFFIIGSAKSGTTTLFDALIKEPEIYMSATKEPGFFSDDQLYSQGLPWYADTYFKNSSLFPVRGEGSTRYLNWSEKTAPRIAEMDANDQVKLIAIFRDPVKRAYSMYWHGIRFGWEKLTFEEAIRTEEHRVSQEWQKLYSSGKNYYTYFREGCYASRLKPFLDLFPRERILLLLQEDLIQDYHGTINKLLSFLDVTSEAEHIPTIRNAYSKTHSQYLRRLLTNQSTLRNITKLFLPLPLRTKIKSTLRKANQEQIQYPPMNKEIERTLRERYRDEIEAFEKIIDRDLSHWYKENS
jgi:hypothetical protein